MAAEHARVWVITAHVPRAEGIKVIVCDSRKSADGWASDILQKVIDQMDIADRIDMTPRAHVPVTADSWESRLADVQERLGAGRCWINVLEHTVIEGGPGDAATLNSARDDVIRTLLVDELLRWRRFARDNGMTDEHYHAADGTGWMTRLDRVLAAAGALPVEGQPTSMPTPAETRPGEKFYQWIVAFDVDAVWIADGFNLDDTRALMMLARDLSFANVNSELRATVLIRPEAAEILREQGVPENALPQRV